MASALLKGDNFGYSFFAGQPLRQRDILRVTKFVKDFNRSKPVSVGADAMLSVLGREIPLWH